MKKVLVLVIMLFTLFSGSVFLHGIMFANNGGCPWFQNCEDYGSTASGERKSSINQLIVEGGYLFFKSRERASVAIGMIELSEIKSIDTDQLKNALDDAYQHMGELIQVYEKIIKITDVTPYNPAALALLTNFDYKGYRDANNLNTSTFADVKAYLGTGDIKGAFNRIKTQSESIMHDLFLLMENPGPVKIQMVWRLNGKYANLCLFGQYLAEVFYNSKR